MSEIFGRRYSRVIEIYHRIVNSKYYHYGQYLSFFVFTYLISVICLDHSISEWLPNISWIISDCDDPVFTNTITQTPSQPNRRQLVSNLSKTINDSHHTDFSGKTNINLTQLKTDSHYVATQFPIDSHQVVATQPTVDSNYVATQLKTDSIATQLKTDSHQVANQPRVDSIATQPRVDSITTQSPIDSQAVSQPRVDSIASQLLVKKTSVYCYGVNTIYRSNMALMTFYLTNLLILMYFRRWFLDYYLIRWVYFLLLGIVSMILPNIIVKVYAIVAVIGSLLFLFLNMVTLIDFTNQLQQYISHNVQKQWLFRCVSTAAILFPIFSLVIDLVVIILFQCMVTRMLVLLNLAMKILIYVQYYIKRNETPTGCFLSCGIVILYNSYVLFTALESGLGVYTFSFGLIFDSLVTVIVILWTGYSIANLHNFLRLTLSDYSDNIFAKFANSESAPIFTNTVGKNFATQEAINEQTKISYNYGTEQTCNEVLTDLYQIEMRSWKRLQQMRVYFMVMILATFAFLTSMTNWQIQPTADSLRQIQPTADNGSTTDTGLVSMWAKVVTVLLTYIGFILMGRWSLPRAGMINIFDREYEYEKIHISA